MKIIALILTTSAILLATGNVFAATTASAKNLASSSQPASSPTDSSGINAGTFGLSVSTTPNSMISGKYFFQNNLAILGGFGLVNSTSGGGTDLYLMAGIRKYLVQYMKSSDLIPFVGARFSHSSVSSTGTNEFTLSAEGGLEYFLSKRFSLEGLVSAGYDSKTPSGGTATTTISTAVYSIGANFYF